MILPNAVTPLFPMFSLPCASSHHRVECFLPSLYRKSSLQNSVPHAYSTPGSSQTRALSHFLGGEGYRNLMVCLLQGPLYGRWAICVQCGFSLSLVSSCRPLWSVRPGVEQSRGNTHPVSLHTPCHMHTHLDWDSSPGQGLEGSVSGDGGVDGCEGEGRQP